MKLRTRRRSTAVGMAKVFVITGRDYDFHCSNGWYTFHLLNILDTDEIKDLNDDLENIGLLPDFVIEYTG